MLDEKLKEYALKFDDGFPMIPLGMGRTEKEVITLIDECISKNKDVYELGYVTDDIEVVY